MSERLCCECGAPWIPVRRGECVRCGSDAGSTFTPNAVLLAIIAEREAG